MPIFRVGDEKLAEIGFFLPVLVILIENLPKFMVLCRPGLAGLTIKPVLRIRAFQVNYILFEALCALFHVCESKVGSQVAI